MSCDKIMTLTIKFSHNYFKLIGAKSTAKLLQVITTNKKVLSKEFIEYDTKYYRVVNNQQVIGHYMLPQGKVLLLIFKSDGVVFTNVRMWTQEKENYYLAGVGLDFEIKIGD